MFVQQKKLTFVNTPSKRVRRLFVSTVDIQVALPDFPSQMVSAYLAALATERGMQILLGFYLVDSRCSVFFMPQAGEVAPEKAEAVLEEGLEFAESMGFVLADADIRHFQPKQRDEYWQKLPICRKSADSVEEVTQVPVSKAAPLAVQKVEPSPVKTAEQVAPVSLEGKMQRCKESLGRFLASL